MSFLSLTEITNHCSCAGAFFSLTSLQAYLRRQPTLSISTPAFSRSASILSLWPSPLKNPLKDHFTASCNITLQMN